MIRVGHCGRGLRRWVATCTVHLAARVLRLLLKWVCLATAAEVVMHLLLWCCSSHAELNLSRPLSQILLLAWITATTASPLRIWATHSCRLRLALDCLKIKVRNVNTSVKTSDGG